jgi:hypothetical protein
MTQYCLLPTDSDYSLNDIFKIKFRYKHVVCAINMLESKSQLHKASRYSKAHSDDHCPSRRGSRIFKVPGIITGGAKSEARRADGLGFLGRVKTLPTIVRGSVGTL